MIKKIEAIINNSPFYNFLRFNPLSDWLVEVLHKKTQRNINFYSSFLDERNSNKLIFDIGANKGNKVKAFVKMGYKTIALEPEKKSLETLYYRFRNDPNVMIVEKAVSEKEGVLQLHIADARSGFNTLSDKWADSLGDEQENRWHQSTNFKNAYEVPVTTVDHLMNDYGIPYFIKIDVEGFEVNVIKGIRRLPNYLSFESNLPEFTNETNEIINYLSQLDPQAKYQYSLDERLASPNWLSKEEIIGIVNNKNIRYLEVICRFEDK